MGCSAEHSNMTGDFDLRTPAVFTSSHLFAACWEGMERREGIEKAQPIQTEQTTDIKPFKYRHMPTNSQTHTHCTHTHTHTAETNARRASKAGIRTRSRESPHKKKEITSTTQYQNKSLSCQEEKGISYFPTLLFSI